MAGITEKQKKFVNEYLIDLNASAAAVRAGYSPKASKEMASRLLTKANIQEYLQKRRNDLQKKAKITAESVIEELAHIAFDDMKNYLAFRTEITKVDETSDGAPVLDYSTVIELKDSDKIDTRNISEVSRGRDGQFKFKLYPKDNALLQLGKHLGLFAEKTGDTDEINKGIKNIAELLQSPVENREIPDE